MSLKLFDLTAARRSSPAPARASAFSLAEGLGRAGARVVLNGRDGQKLDAAASAFARRASASRRPSST